MTSLILIEGDYTMKIGNVKLEKNVFLAPMAGVTDRAFRRICREYGCGLVYTEMISSKGLYYKDKKTASLMKICGDEQPAAIQIFGSDPDIMGETAKAAESTGAVLIDINMGCPAPKIVNNGDGSALMKNPQLAGKIIERVSKAVGIPVTVKFRKGWDNESVNAQEFAKIAEESGAAAICIHGRTRMQFYSGKADWDIIKKVKACVNIPVIGNGDIFCAQDALDMMNLTKCDAVMIARGAEGNPFLFRQTEELLKKGGVSYYPTDRERIDCAIKHARLLTEYKGEKRGIKEARKHMAWYLKGMRGSSAIKTDIFKAETLSEMEEILQNYHKDVGI